MYKFLSSSEEDTINFANNLASYLDVRDIIILSGDLGSGKTKFTEGILKYFHIENEISSPTFTIVNEYHSKNIIIYHFDVYKLSDCDEFYAIGGDEYFSNGLCLIEWGEIIEDILPDNYLKIEFSRNFTDDNIRELTFIPHGDRFKKIISEVIF